MYLICYITTFPHKLILFYILNDVVSIGKKGTRADKLRSIVAQMEYSHQTHKWTDSNVPFTTHLYVPETHPLTLATFHEREDEGHVFKVYAIGYQGIIMLDKVNDILFSSVNALVQRIVQHTRMGGPAKLQLERFRDAAYDPSTGLTYSTLTGEHKQSIGDVERLFNPHVTEYMERNAYAYEARYVKAIHN